MTRPYRVGLTGGIGSGKSVVAGMFADLGVPVIDADAIVHDLTRVGQPALRQITEAFGSVILDSTGQLKRDVLRNIVFTDEGSRLKLESILHPLVYKNMENLLDHTYAEYCILSIPLLLETNAADRVDTILVVDTPETLQIERVCRRDGVSPEQAQAIIKSQIPRATRLEHADHILKNDGDLQDLRVQVEKLHNHYLREAKARNR